MNGLALFAGVAGLDLGVRLAFPSSRTVCYVEGEAYAASVLVSQMQKGALHEAPIWSNVVTFDGKPWCGKVDFITAGFPCQPWSKAGKLEKTKDERWLWHDIERIICETRPQYLFLENVPGIIHGGICEILKSLAESGFNVEWGCIKASDVGANHRRDRAFIFAYCAKRGCNIPDASGPRLFDRWGKNENSGGSIFEGGGLEGVKSPKCCENVPDSDHHRQYAVAVNEKIKGPSQFENVPDAYPRLCNREGQKIPPRWDKFESSGENNPDAYGQRSGEGRGIQQRSNGQFIISTSEPGRISSNSRYKGLQRSKEAGNTSQGRENTNQLPAGLCEVANPQWWQTEPSVGRVVDGLAYRVDRLRACGNGVVPLQAATAYAELYKRAVEGGG